MPVRRDVAWCNLARILRAKWRAKKDKAVFVELNSVWAEEGGEISVLGGPMGGSRVGVEVPAEDGLGHIDVPATELDLSLEGGETRRNDVDVPDQAAVINVAADCESKACFLAARLQTRVSGHRVARSLQCWHKKDGAKCRR